MKALSDTLEAMKSSGAMQRVQPHGLTTTGGQTTTPRNLPAVTQPIPNQQVMNALSLLASVGAKDKTPGSYGIVNGQYDFIPNGKQALDCKRDLTPAEFYAVEPLIPPANIDIIRIHLGRLALIKKIGSASEMTMGPLINDMAFELAEFSQLAVLLAFREIKRQEGAWMPELGAIISCCEKWQTYVDNIWKQKDAQPVVKLIE